MWEKSGNDCLLEFNLCLDQPLHLPLTFLPSPGSSNQRQTLPTGGIWSDMNRATLNLNCKEILNFSKRPCIGYHGKQLLLLILCYSQNRAAAMTQIRLVLHSGIRTLSLTCTTFCGPHLELDQETDAGWMKLKK